MNTPLIQTGPGGAYATAYVPRGKRLAAVPADAAGRWHSGQEQARRDATTRRRPRSLLDRLLGIDRVDLSQEARASAPRPVAKTPRPVHGTRTPTMNLTPKQLRILQLVRDWRVTHGFSPTMQELANELGISKVTVFEHVEALIKKGALVREPNKARSLSISEDAPLPDEGQTLSFPLVGRIAAGLPIERLQDGDQLEVESLFGPRVGQRGGTFALMVEGESMRDEGILDGDYVLVERRDTARNGERVVALLPDGETTLKTFFKEGGKIRLQPANPDFEPIIVDDCQVQGVVIGVLRSYR